MSFKGCEDIIAIMVLKCLTCILLHCFDDPFTVHLMEVHLVGILVLCEYLVCSFHGLNDFGYGHPVGDFTGKPRVVLGVPHIKVCDIPSDDLQSFHIGNQHGFAIFGHLVLGSYPGHGQAFLACRILPSRVQFTLQGEMVSERSGRLQFTHSLRMWICQRRKSVGVGFMGLGFGKVDTSRMVRS